MRMGKPNFGEIAAQVDPALRHIGRACACQDSVDQDFADRDFVDQNFAGKGWS